MYAGGDNRLSLWDVDTKKRRHVYVEKNHLSHSYTCISWRHGKKDSLGLLAFGCSDGSVIIWELLRGVVSVVIPSPSQNSNGSVPVDVEFSNDGKSLFVCYSNTTDVSQCSTKDGSIVRTLKGHKKGNTKIARNPQADVVAICGNTIKIVDVSSSQKKKLDGHFSGSVRSAEFTQCGRYLAAASFSAKEVLLFDVQADAVNGAAPLFVFPTTQSVKSIKTRSVGESIELLCAYEAGGGCFFRYDINGDSMTNVELSCSSDNSEIMDLSFGIVGKSAGVLMARSGSGGLPNFTSHAVEDGSGILFNSAVTIAAVSSANGELKQSSGEKSADLSTPSVLGPNEFGGEKRPLLDTDETSSAKKSKSGEAAEEQTLEERLAALSNDMNILEQVSSSNNSKKVDNIVPTSDSLVVLIDQALQAGDDALLEQCFSCEDVAVVDATCMRLPTSRVVSLLRRLVSKFEKRPSRGLLLTRWLSSLVRFHTGYLITVPDLSQQLAGLSQMLEQRLGSYGALAGLGGRLDLLLAQVSNSEVGVGQNQGKAKPTAVFVE